MIHIVCKKARKFCVIPISISSEKKTYSEADSDVKRLVLEVIQRFRDKKRFPFVEQVSFSFEKSHLPRVDKFDFGGKTKAAIASFDISCPLEIKPRVEAELRKIAHRHGGEFIKKKHGAMRWDG